MKRNQVIELTIESFRFPNKGVGTFEGKPVEVKNALPGERVQARVKRSREQKAEAKWMTTLAPATHHIPPPCVHYSDCGGCQRQQLLYKDQLALKAESVKNLLELDAEVFEGIVASPSPWGYRNKMEYSFGDAEKDGPMTLGLHRRGRFMDVVTTDQCRIVHDDFNDILSHFLKFFRDRGLVHYNKKTHRGILRHLVIRRGERTQELLIGLSVADPAPIDEKDLIRELLSLTLEGKIVGVLLLVNPDQGDVVKAGDVRLLYGRDFYHEELLGLRFQVSFFSFFQTNTSGAERLYREAVAMLSDRKDPVIYDLYSGTGTIAQVMAKGARSVHGVELIEEAVEAARKNAAINGLDHVTFYAGDVFDTLPAIKESPDVIVVDPPRTGLGKKAVERIGAYGVKEILYISCNPVTLKEDIEGLRQAGYRVKRVKLVDLFAQTYHVETICLLEREPADLKKTIMTDHGKEEEAYETDLMEH